MSVTGPRANRPRITSISQDRRTLRLACHTDAPRIEVLFKGEPVEFTVQADTAADGPAVVLAKPLGQWDGLGGFTEVVVDDVPAVPSDELILVERERLRSVISRQAGAREATPATAPAPAAAKPEAPSHGVVVPEAGSITSSLVPLPVGSTSTDGSAVVGRGGHLFILGGSNALAARYAPPTTPAEHARVRDEVDAWVTLIEQREEQLSALGVRFVQMCVPDKSTMLETGVPGLGPITPVLRGIEERLAGSSSYASGREALTEGVHVEGLGVTENWLRLDSHTRPRGARRLSAAMVRGFDEAPFFDDVDFSDSDRYVGDLGTRFFGAPIPEPIEAPRAEWITRAESGRALVDRHAPAKGHMGRTMHWKAPQAPIDAKVVVFGNSFFGATDVPMACNYWISRAFREHRFVWSADMLMDVVRDQRPDVVICQTVERFMGRVPGA